MKDSTSRIHLPAWIVLVLMMTAFFNQEAVAQKKQKSVEKKGSYANASYSRKEASSFMRTWWITGPMLISATPDPDSQLLEEAFKKDVISQVEVVAGKPFPAVHYQNADIAWKLNTSVDDITDLDALHNKADYVFAYALAEIQSDSVKKTFLAVGSDDGIKVWHNGKLIHDNWVGRGITPDQDVVPIDLIKGSNQILLKVQDGAGGWSFTARLLSKKDYTEKLIDGARRGDIDQMNLFLAAGADVNGKGSTGLTALDVAKISGRDEVVELLKKKGALENKVPSGEALVDQIYKPFPDKLSSGVAVLISKDGKIIYKKGFGYADIPAKTPVTTTTKFRIGSITKQFTASGILKLQEEGKLSVTDKLSKYFPDFPRGNEVTIHHLLTHTSGIHSYTGKADFMEKVVKPITNEALLAYFVKDEYDFNPGEQYRYNNSGYFLLGYIIEKVSGKSYAQYLKETFFAPLQMNNTGVHTSALKLDQEAKGYTKENGAYKLAPNWDMSWAGGAGALYSTVEDLYTWNEAVFSGKVLTKASIDAAFTPVVLNNGKIPDGTRYGYGWGLDSYRGEEMIGHSGGLHGFISQLARYPEDNMTVVILTNISPPEGHLNPHLIAECFLWEKMDKQKSFVAQTNDNVNVKIYEGRFDFKNGAVMTITSEGNNLFAQLTGQQKFPIFPSGPDEYFWKVVDARIKFEKNEKGEVTLGHFEQGTFKIDVVKIPDVAIVKLDPAIYRTYIGKYDYGNSLIITVTEEQGRIFAQATNQPKFEIFPTAEKEFILKEINAKITFVKETDGKISKMIVDMAGQQKDAPKVE